MKKLNWGTGIVITLVLFISFILYFVIKMSTDSAYEYDLVRPDYYKHEIEYQQRIDKLNNAKQLEQNVSIRIVDNGIYIDFPKNTPMENIQGTVYLYRPSNKILDVILPISATDHSQFISKDILIDGRWDIQVAWNIGDKKYLFQHSVNI